MAKFVPDIKSNRWVIIAPARVTRPHDNTVMSDKSVTSTPCPFCSGQESLNKTVFSVGNVRVIANKYPLTQFHEVIIHSPDHEKDIDELPLRQVELLLNVYRQRYNYYRAPACRQAGGTVLIFNNHDIHAGASLAHPHSQLVVVPKQINLDSMDKEPVQNEVARTKHFVAYCPDFSQWPYEIWLTPLTENKNFGEITDEQIKDLAEILQKILKAVVNKFNLPAGRQENKEDIPYNFYIYHGENWYLRIIPRFIHRAGFELGTGILVNIVDPKTAAEEYKNLLSHS